MREKELRCFSVAFFSRHPCLLAILSFPAIGPLSSEGSVKPLFAGQNAVGVKTKARTPPVEGDGRRRVAVARSAASASRKMEERTRGHCQRVRERTVL